MAGLGPRSAIERAESGNSRPTVVRACALLDHPSSSTVDHDGAMLTAAYATFARLIKTVGIQPEERDD